MHCQLFSPSGHIDKGIYILWNFEVDMGNKQLDIEFWSSKGKSQVNMKLESSALDGIEAIGMDKILQEDNIEGEREMLV